MHQHQLQHHLKPPTSVQWRCCSCHPTIYSFHSQSIFAEQPTDLLREITAPNRFGSPFEPLKLPSTLSAHLHKAGPVNFVVPNKKETYPLVNPHTLWIFPLLYAQSSDNLHKKEIGHPKCQPQHSSPISPPFRKMKTLLQHQPQKRTTYPRCFPFQSTPPRNASLHGLDKMVLHRQINPNPSVKVLNRRQFPINR